MQITYGGVDTAVFAEGERVQRNARRYSVGMADTCARDVEVGEVACLSRPALKAKMAGHEVPTERVAAAALDPTALPHHLRYGDMTAIPLVQRLKRLPAWMGSKAISRDKSRMEGRKCGMVVLIEHGGGRGGGGGGGTGEKHVVVIKPGWGGAGGR